MEAVVLVIHLMLAVALIGLVLIQRSEGGGLGIGGGGGGLGQFASVRSTANALTKATALCAGGFFVTSLILAYLAGTHTAKEGILEEFGKEIPANVATTGENEMEDAVPVVPPSAPISE